jgi:PAS domain S-box-containing protein
MIASVNIQPRILSVDDDPDVQQTIMVEMGSGVNNELDDFLTNTYKLAGFNSASTTFQPQFRIDTASSGEEGLEKVTQSIEENDPYSVILLDMRMPPGWDGLKTAKEIKVVDSATQVIFVSAYSDYNLNEIRREIGLDFEFISKPIDFSELTELILICNERWQHHHEYTRLKQERDKEHLRNDSILRSIPEGVIVLDQHGTIEIANSKIENLSGYADTGLAGHSFQKHFHKAGESRGSFFEEISPTVVDRIQRFHDRENAYFHRLLEEAPLAIFVVNIDHNQQRSIFIINAEMEKFLGYPPHSLGHHSIETLIHEEDIEQFNEIIFNVGQGNLCIPKSKEIRLLTASQGELAIPLCLISVKCSHEQHLIVLPVVAEQMEQALFNLAPEKHIELEEKVDNWFLNHRNGKRVSVRLSGTALYDYIGEKYQFSGAVLVIQDFNELLSAESERLVNQSKDEFLASMSHELRTPLTTIIGNSEIILGSLLRPILPTSPQHH